MKKNSWILVLASLLAFTGAAYGSDVTLGPLDTATGTKLQAGGFPYSELEELAEKALDQAGFSVDLDVSINANSASAEKGRVHCDPSDPANTPDQMEITVTSILKDVLLRPGDFPSLTSGDALGSFLGTMFHELGHLCVIQGSDTCSPQNADGSFCDEFAAENFARNKMCEAVGAICTRLSEIDAEISDIENEQSSLDPASPEHEALESEKGELEAEKEKLKKISKAMCSEIDKIVKKNAGEKNKEAACACAILDLPPAAATAACPDYDTPSSPSNPSNPDGSFGDGDQGGGL